MCAATLPLALSGPAPAQAADPCTTPQLSDVMVSQGLPTPHYRLLARGKTTLVKFFLSTPSCLPAGATIRVSAAKLFVSSVAEPLALKATLPLPPLGSPSTAPVPGSASDVLFVVPGSVLKTATSPVSFSAEVEYLVTTTAGEVKDVVVFATQPGTSQPISGTLTDPLPTGLLIVPMGDGAKTVDDQYPTAAKSALQTGMQALTRLLPVADDGQLTWRLNGGMVNLGKHFDVFSNSTVTWIDREGDYCGDAAHFGYISGKLEEFRTAWNSISANPRAHRALGQVWQDHSKGATTVEGNTCLDGFAPVPGTSAWSRTVGTSLDGTSVTGALAAMELAHTTGNVRHGDARSDGSFHSKNVEADGPAPDRAYNVSSFGWIQQDRSIQHYTARGWNDQNTLLEKQDWDWVQCGLLPVMPDAPAGCKPGSLAHAAAAPGGTFVVAGSTHRTTNETHAYSYSSSDPRTDLEDADSEYRFVQRDAQGGILSETGIPVPFHAEGHDGTATGTEHHLDVGAFGAAVADASTPLKPVQTIQLYRGRPSEGGRVLYEMTRDGAPPSFVAVDAQGKTVTVTVQDERPHDLRLDVLSACPSGSSPLTTANSPQEVVGTTAVFVVEADASASCTAGTLVYRATDGFASTIQTDAKPTVGSLTGAAAIHTPVEGTVTTAFRSVAVSGSGRDASGLPATRLDWLLSGPSYTASTSTADGASGIFVAPAGGFPAGQYTLTMTAYGRSAAGSQDVIGTQSRTLLIRADRDGDGISDDDEQRSLHPCYPEDAANDARTALQDADADGLANIDDPQPCVSRNNVTVSFNPQSLFRSSSGQTVTLYLSSAQLDLRNLKASDVYITQIAGYSAARLAGSTTALPAVSWEATSATTARAKFDRSALVAALNTQPTLLGYVPILIGTLDGSLRGSDPVYPHVFP